MKFIFKQTHSLGRQSIVMLLFVSFDHFRLTVIWRIRWAVFFICVGLLFYNVKVVSLFDGFFLFPQSLSDQIGLFGPFPHLNLMLLRRFGRLLLTLGHPHTALKTHTPMPVIKAPSLITKRTLLGLAFLLQPSVDPFCPLLLCRP